MVNDEEWINYAKYFPTSGLRTFNWMYMMVDGIDNGFLFGWKNVWCINCSHFHQICSGLWIPHKLHVKMLVFQRNNEQCNRKYSHRNSLGFFFFSKKAMKNIDNWHHSNGMSVYSKKTQTLCTKSLRTFAFCLNLLDSNQFHANSTKMVFKQFAIHLKNGRTLKVCPSFKNV